MKEHLKITLLVFFGSISLVFSQKRTLRAAATPPVMYIIKVINSKDPTIGKECHRDEENISFLFERIAESLEIELKQQTVTGCQRLPSNWGNLVRHANRVGKGFRGWLCCRFIVF